jgi:hypothetical protein
MKKPSKKLQLINMLIKKYGYSSYVEIGSRKRKTLKGVRVKEKCGVDPAWPSDYKMTSDKFFKQNQRMFDIILVEGCREGKQPYKDILNSLKILTPNGTIIVRGANQPKEWFYNKKLKIPRYKERVWQAVSQIHVDHEDLILITAEDECGLTVIKRGRGKRYKYDGKLSKEYFLKHRKELINLVTWKQLKHEISRPDGIV